MIQNSTAHSLLSRTPAFARLGQLVFTLESFFSVTVGLELTVTL